MSEPFVGEIRMFAGNFAPRGWAFCDGQLLATSQNDALFSLLGTIYGGDGRTTFGLPDARGRIPLHMGTGPGLSTRPLGSKGGSETETLTVNQMPSHSHNFRANSANANVVTAQGRTIAAGVNAEFYLNETQDTSMASTMITNSGSNFSHTNLMPTLCINFIIALFGIYPSRN